VAFPALTIAAVIFDESNSTTFPSRFLIFSNMFVRLCKTLKLRSSFDEDLHIQHFMRLSSVKKAAEIGI
jgi:hypothetical protein